MSESKPIFVPASSEFVSLCQSQVTLLSQGFGATWSAVYLAQELVEDAQTQLIPVVVYPETGILLPYKEVRGLPQAWKQHETPRFLSGVIREEEMPQDSQWGEDWFLHHQIVIPLIYEEIVMGLLVTRRDEPEWTEGEITQVNRIARTLAIACLLDQRQAWYKQQLIDTQRFQQQQHDHFDDVLHQIRNPLTALRTFGKLLLRRLSPEDKNHSVAESIVRESDRVSELLHHFDPYLEQIETQSLKLLPSLPPTPSLLPSSTFSVEPIALPELMPPLLVSAEAIAQEKGQTLSVDILPQLPPVEANASALREVVNNLVDNAIKYTPSGGKIDVQIGLQQFISSHSFQGIAIRDNGPGIPLEDQPQIFERHYRGKQAESEIPGSGLGLAIAQELVQKMNGKIQLISPTNEGIGTQFIIWLPEA